MNHVKKAQEFYSEMEDSFSRGHGNVCVSNSVLAIISIVDAIAIQQLGKESSSENHIETAMLLNDIKTSDENRKSNLKYDIIEVIRMKTPSQYEERLMSKGDAEKAVNRCNKIYTFLLEEIKKRDIM